MVLESQDEYDSQWAAICSIAPKIGCTPETLRVWVRQHERDTGGGDGGLTSAERQRLKELERENRELRVQFFRLLNRRYEKASIILTSNKGFADWGEMFGEHVLATAILDRLLHHSTTLNIKGESYRFNIPDRLVVHLSLHARPELRAHNT
ncbi:istB-like ATP binding family protein [Escherichia coli B84]|nr:istB-like ATP binding family protein [Escherichia coli B84]